jgi:small subunit ribosomal protein S16
VIEELGYYDPAVNDTDARVVLKNDRVDYWLGVGAQPSEKVRVLIKKYGTGGTHLEAQKQALERLGSRQTYTPPAEPAETPAAKPEAAKSDQAPAEAAADAQASASADQPPAESEQAAPEPAGDESKSE